MPCRSRLKLRVGVVGRVEVRVGPADEYSFIFYSLRPTNHICLYIRNRYVFCNGDVVLLERSDSNT